MRYHNLNQNLLHIVFLSFCLRLHAVILMHVKVHKCAGGEEEEGT